MDSLANYDSDGENSNNSIENKMSSKEKHNTHERSANDVNYDSVQMDMSEESNNNNSSGDSGSDKTRTPPPSHHSSSSRSGSTRTRKSSSDQRRSDHESNTTNHSRSESKRTEKSDRTRSSDDRWRHSSSDSRRQRDSDRRDIKHSRDSHIYLSAYERRDLERRHARIRTKGRHRDVDLSAYHHREKYRARSRSRSRSKEHAPQSFRSMSYRDEKSRNKLAQLEKLGIELKAPEGTTVTPVSLGEQNHYNPYENMPQKYAEQILKRKLLWANKKKQEDSKPTNTAVAESTASTWIGTTFTHDEDGKLVAKFKRLMGIKDNVPTVPPLGQKPDILKKQEEMFSNMEQQYEVARATTHTQRGVGLGYASSGYQFPR